MIYHEQYILLVFKIIPISLIASLSVFWQRSCQHPSFSPSCSLTSNSLRSGVPITWIKMARRVFQSFILIYLFLCVRLPMQMLVLASYIYRQIITLAFIPMDSLESPINLSMFWTVGRSWSTWRKPTHAQGEHANSTQKDPRLR